MISKIVAVQGDDFSKININSDTSIFLAYEAQKIKYKIFYYHPNKLSIINSKVIAEGCFVKFNYANKKFYKILKKQKLSLDKCKFILIRQDPPFNLDYISTTYMLETLTKNVKIINNPKSIRNISEKFYSKKFIQYMPNTIFSKNILEIKKFLKKNKEIIIKPVHGYGGNDIHFIKKFSLTLIEKLISKHGYLMCQRYLKNIKFGDKRVFIINGKVEGAISRVPKKGSFLSNMSKGAKPKLISLSKSEIQITKLISKDLKKQNIYFAGIDFIDGKLNGDINVTSPTGLKTFFDLSNKNLAKVFWKGLGS